MFPSFYAVFVRSKTSAVFSFEKLFFTKFTLKSCQFFCNWDSSHLDENIKESTKAFHSTIFIQSQTVLFFFICFLLFMQFLCGPKRARFSVLNLG